MKPLTPRWIAALLLPLAAFSLCVSPCLPHDFKLRRMTRDWAAIDHPPGSRLILQVARLGLLEGNGNHCDYFVGELRVTTLTPEALKTFYPSTVLVQLADGDPTVGDGPLEELLIRGAAELRASNETVYVAYVFDQEPPGVDFRCH